MSNIYDRKEIITEVIINPLTCRPACLHASRHKQTWNWGQKPCRDLKCASKKLPLCPSVWHCIYEKHIFIWHNSLCSPWVQQHCLTALHRWYNTTGCQSANWHQCRFVFKLTGTFENNELITEITNSLSCRSACYCCWIQQKCLPESKHQKSWNPGQKTCRNFKKVAEAIRQNIMLERLYTTPARSVIE